VLVVGGGPGGLFFALLAKRARPDLDVHVVEQNADGATYGWGVVFTDRAVEVLGESAPDVFEEIAARKPPVDHMDIIVRDARLSIHGNVFFRIGRVDLLAILQRHARDAGVTIEFERRIEAREELSDWDLVVGADGVNSVVRELLADSFLPEVSFGRNWWAWYGTHQLFPAVSLIFEPQPEGLFIGHAYQYNDNLSGFVVEVVPSAFDAHGFADLDDQQSRPPCVEIFERHLGGHELLSNRSLWFQPKFVSCAQWVAGNVTLIGDALHTVHPSIGSGTRFAMRDAVSLCAALEEHGADVASLLAGYEARRRRRADGFQAAARRSIAWYEALAARDLGDPTRFALEYIMRTGRVRYEDFRRLNPEIISAYERPASKLTDE
jgi:2-polyprenyl-6-methoxyphenol hydroxylase-like FAD-dependent oxidoreductase